MKVDTGATLTVMDLALVAVPVLLVALAGKPYIDFLRNRYMGQYIREDGPQSHHKKAGTPTMGGLLMLAAVTIGLLAAWLLYGSTVITTEVWLAFGVTMVFGLLGGVDDYLKISKKKNKGVTGYTKLAVQTGAGLIVGWYVMQTMNRTMVDFFGIETLDLRWFYPLFAALVINGTSNAVNLTDGLDGLAATIAVLAFAALTLLLNTLGMTTQMPYFHGLALYAWLMAGACIGFLMYNAHPAKVFMGDTGSLAIGGALGALAVLGGVEFWLVLIGGIFVIETLSVILQVLSFKTTGKRIFRMSPLHHHFELGGWHETKVVTVFVLVELALCILALFLYNSAL